MIPLFKSASWFVTSFYNTLSNRAVAESKNLTLINEFAIDLVKQIYQLILKIQTKILLKKVFMEEN